MTTQPLQPVCIVEDDPDTRSLIRSVVDGLQLPCIEFDAGKPALNSLASQNYLLIILDVGLPDVDGFEICRMIRAAGSSVPIIFVTSRADEIDRISGFSNGGDDYVTKPFSDVELGLRLRAILRRAKAEIGAASLDEGALLVPLHFGALEIDPDKRRVALAKQVVPLTALEFDVLYFLALNAGRPFSRDELAEEVWGVKSSQFGPTVTTLMNRLRKKLEPDLNKPTFIRTVYGVGYRFLDPSTEIDDLAGTS